MHYNAKFTRFYEAQRSKILVQRRVIWLGLYKEESRLEMIVERIGLEMWKLLIF